MIRLARRLVAVTDSNSDYLAEVNRRRTENENRIRIIPTDRPYVAPEFFNLVAQVPSSTADSESRNVKVLGRPFGKSETGLELFDLRMKQVLLPFLSDNLTRRLVASTADVPGILGAKMPPTYESKLGPTIKPMGRPPKGERPMSKAEKQRQYRARLKARG